MNSVERLSEKMNPERRSRQREKPESPLQLKPQVNPALFPPSNQPSEHGILRTVAKPISRSPDYILRILIREVIAAPLHNRSGLK